ncbi:MAG: hypothetical protein IPM55_22955 [Acidobacteria bacterium]|nr:hypothetical protein [Acidobacteriota bacterium]
MTDEYLAEVPDLAMFQAKRSIPTRFVSDAAAYPADHHQCLTSGGDSADPTA